MTMTLRKTSENGQLVMNRRLSEIRICQTIIVRVLLLFYQKKQYILIFC